MNYLLALAELELAIAIGLAGSLWLGFLRSLPRRRHPLAWAVGLAVFTAYLIGSGALILNETPARQAAVLSFELLALTGYLFWALRRGLRPRPPRSAEAEDSVRFVIKVMGIFGGVLAAIGVLIVVLAWHYNEASHVTYGFRNNTEVPVSITVLASARFQAAQIVTADLIAFPPDCFPPKGDCSAHFVKPRPLLPGRKAKVTLLTSDVGIAYVIRGATSMEGCLLLSSKNRNNAGNCSAAG